MALHSPFAIFALRKEKEAYEDIFFSIEFCDDDGVEAAGIRLKDFGEKVTIVRSNYCDMKSQLQKLGIDKVDGIVLDLGVSSYQLDTAERGFSYREDAPLDMRMDRRQEMTARDIVNDYSEMDLYRVIRDYGEDKFAKNIARHIVAERAKRPIETTGQLVEIIRHAIPMKYQKKSGHPAKRTFQAIRIELNTMAAGRFSLRPERVTTRSGN